MTLSGHQPVSIVIQSKEIVHFEAIDNARRTNNFLVSNSLQIREKFVKCKISMNKLVEILNEHKATKFMAQLIKCVREAGIQNYANMFP